MRGHYHEFIPDVNTPIERKMAEAEFCEIEDNFLLIPYQNPGLIKKGYLPVKELSNESICLILENDVFGYFEDVTEKYNTPLKAKRFKNSQEYAELKLQLDSIKKQLLKNTFYTIRSLSEDEIFDLDKQLFKIRLPYVLTDNYICFESNDPHFDEYDFTTPQIDEDTAFKIESNPCEIIIFVKFTGYGIDKQAICEPTEVYIADKKTGYIYFEYTPNDEFPEETSNVEDEIVEDEIVQHTEPIEVTNEDKVYERVEVMPEFPGGIPALFTFISEHLIYPEEAQQLAIQGRVIVRFVVGKDGTLSNFKISKGSSLILDSEALRVCKHPEMPKWKPGRHNGEPVNVYMYIPINFRYW